MKTDNRNPKGSTTNLWFAYFDSTRHTFSVRDQYTRKVVLKASLLVLTDCRFAVSERGRQRVLREKRKTVHAGVVAGRAAVPNRSPDIALLTPVRYNPYEGPHFTTLDGRPVFESPRVVMRVEGGRARVYAQA